jgi:hypothetical protein
MKILLGDFNAKVGGEYIKKKNDDESLHIISYDNGTLPHQKSAKSTMFSHCNIPKFTWTSYAKIHNQIYLF